MSESEKFEVQGRAHARLKEHESKIAALTVSLRDYAGELVGTGRAVETFILDPGQRNPGARAPQVESLRDQLQRIESGIDRARFQLQEIFEEASNARLLRDQIEKF